MAALDSQALLLEYGNVYVGDDDASAVDLGAVRNVQFIGVQTALDIRSDNRGSVVRKNRINGTIQFDWLEAGDMAKLENILKGLVTLTTNAGSLVSGATQDLESPFVAGKFYELENQNGDGTAPTINSVTGATDGALVANDDYILTQNGQGKWGIVMNSVAGGITLTTLSQVVTIDYDYTPNASLAISGGTSRVATERYVKIVGPSADDATKERTVVLTEAVVDGDITLPFLDTEEANDVGVMPITFINDKNATWSITDEINPN